MATRQIRCKVETMLGMEDALLLDAFLSDPKQWPKAIFEGWDLPVGPLPGNFRSWGATKIGMEWCESRGHKVRRADMEKHVAEHVPILPYSTDDYAERGAPKDDMGRAVVPTDAISYIEVFKKGLSVGYTALDALEQRVNKMIEAGQSVPIDLALEMAKLGTKLATAQASIMAKGARMGGEQDEEIEGFRSGTAPLPSQRLGHHRIRIIDGQARPIRDEGPSDRHEYNERAEQEGGEALPAP